MYVINCTEIPFVVISYPSPISRLKSPKNRFQLSAGLNLETMNTILSGTNHI